MCGTSSNWACFWFFKRWLFQRVMNLTLRHWLNYSSMCSPARCYEDNQPVHLAFLDGTRTSLDWFGTTIWASDPADVLGYTQDCFDSHYIIKISALAWMRCRITHALLWLRQWAAMLFLHIRHCSSPSAAQFTVPVHGIRPAGRGNPCVTDPLTKLKKIIESEE